MSYLLLPYYLAPYEFESKLEERPLENGTGKGLSQV